MEGVRGIGFDLDHTLAIDNRLERVAFLQLLELLESRGGHALGTLGDEIEAIDDLLHRQRCAELTLDEAIESFVLERGARPGGDYARWFRDQVLSMVPQFVIALPNVRTTIATLRERAIAMAVLTNGWNPLQLRKAERAGFNGPVLVSTDIGERKPDAGAFEQLLERMGTPPAQTWYVGDDPRGDIAGAHAAGMPAVWINWERKEFPADLRPPEHTIARFEELLALIPEVAPAS